MHRISYIAIPCFALSLAMAPAQADADICSATAPLALIYDAYSALDLAETDRRQEAAMELLALHLPALRPETIAQELSGAGIAVSETQLRQILSDAAERARYEMGTGRKTHDRTRHDANRLWLSGTIFETGCDVLWSARTPSAPQTATRGFADALQHSLEGNLRLRSIAIVSLGLAAIVGGIAYCKSHRFRKTQLTRQPRASISLPAIVTWHDDNGLEHSRFVRALDLSLGGCKLGWEDALPTGATLSLEVGPITKSATIVWRNDFYAGLLLETALEKAEQAELITLNARTPAVRSVPTSKSSALPPSSRPRRRHRGSA